MRRHRARLAYGRSISAPTQRASALSSHQSPAESRRWVPNPSGALAALAGEASEPGTDR